MLLNKSFNHIHVSHLRAGGEKEDGGEKRDGDALSLRHQHDLGAFTLLGLPNL